MAILNRFSEMFSEISTWRRDLHAHPELRFEEYRTAAFVASKLKEFGVNEIVTGFGGTGVVGVIHGRIDTSGRSIGFRADMDALPIQEVNDLPHASRAPGKMHACGHDGHTSMLLGAAKYLAETRNFDGKIVLAFQPAEEGGGGARASHRRGPAGSRQDTGWGGRCAGAHHQSSEVARRRLVHLVVCCPRARR